MNNRNLYPVKMHCWFCEEDTKTGVYWEDERSRYYYCNDCYIFYNNWLYEVWGK